MKCVLSCTRYQLGIADDFNICSLGKANAEHIVQQIADEMVLVHIQNPPPMFAPMAHAYIDGLNLIARSKVFSLASTLALVTPLFTGVVPPLDAGDWWRMQWRKVYFNAIKYIPGGLSDTSYFLLWQTVFKYFAGAHSSCGSIVVYGASADLRVCCCSSCSIPHPHRKTGF